MCLPAGLLRGDFLAEPRVFLAGESTAGDFLGDFFALRVFLAGELASSGDLG